MKRTLGRWWRRERLAVALLPIALIAVLVGSASRLNTLWWSQGFHDEASTSGGWTQIDDEYDDGYQKYPIRAEVRMDSVRAIDEVAGSRYGTKVATGGQLWEVRLLWRADPDMALRGCNLAIFDRHGVEYDAGSSGWDGSSSAPSDECLPEDRNGPRAEIGSTAQPTVPEGEEPRPERWTSTAYVVTKAGIKPATVRVWYFLPRYAELVVPAGTSAAG